MQFFAILYHGKQTAAFLWVAREIFMTFELRVGSQFQDLIHSVRPSLMVEVGSWQGASIIRFLQEADGAGLDTHAICVDTWLGSPEHWLNKNPSGEWAFSALGVSNGEPQFIETFRRNIEDFGYSGRVELVRAGSEAALAYLEVRGTQPDLIYIDGDHSRRAVLKDIQLSVRLSRNGVRPIISGDDWTWVDVRRAVILSAIRLGSGILVKGKMWVFAQRNSPLEAEFVNRGWARVPAHLFAKYLLDYSRLAKVYRKALRRLIRRFVDPFFRLISRG